MRIDLNRDERSAARPVVYTWKHWMPFLLPVIFLVGFLAYRNIEFSQACSGHLKLAADANTPALAISELEVAVEYLEKKGLTSGYTSIFIRMPKDNIGFWYTNLRDSLLELKRLSPEASELEKSNTLMKLRQTLLDHTPSGESVTVPSSIAIFPYNRLLAGFSVVWALVAGIAGYLMFFERVSEARGPKLDD